MTETLAQPEAVRRWLLRWRSGSGERRLFCFPYAGGSASAYARWHRDLPDDVEVCAVELPGRPRRADEPPVGHLGTLLRDLSAVIAPLMDRPCAFFGHSMGALVAAEVAATLQRAGGPTPQALVVSGLPAPDRLTAATGIPVSLTREELVRQLTAWGGTPPEVLSYPEMIDLLHPVLEADLSMCAQYRPSPAATRLDCPLYAFGGRQDAVAPVPDLLAWSAWTTDWRGSRLFPGGHFFIQSAESDVLKALSGVLTAMVAP